MHAFAIDRRSLLLSAGALMLLGSTRARAATPIGQPAPDFELHDTQGRPVRLSDYKGRLVVLEWTNPGCPFVQKHYDSKNMQSLQQAYGARGVVWLSINSTARGQADHLGPAALQARYASWGGAQRAMLMDESGRVGRAYGARTTPHMYVVDALGVLVYAGGIDDKRSTRVEDLKTARNFVRAALDETLAGQPVSTPTAAPYGCSIKYGADA